MTPEPQKTETLEEIAERIVEHSWFDMPIESARPQLKRDILSALLNERERAIKILNDARHEGCTDLRELIARIR